MKKRMFAIFALSAVMLCACGKKEAPGDIDVAVPAGGEASVTGGRIAVETEAGQEEGRTLQEGADPGGLEAYGKALFQEDGSIGVIFEGNVLSREEELADTSVHRVMLADVEDYKAGRRDAGREGEKTDEEWLAIMLKGYMKQKEIPEGMALREKDSVVVRIVSTGSAKGYEGMEGTEKNAMIGNGGLGIRADAALLGASVGDTVRFKETVPDTGEEVEIELKILSASGDREMEDLCDGWVKANYPEYAGTDEFLDWVLSKRVRGIQVLNADAELSRFLDFLVKNSTAKGVEEGSHQACMLVEAAYLSAHGLPVTEEAYREYLGSSGRMEEECSKTEFVEGLLKQAMYEDLGGDEHWVEN